MSMRLQHCRHFISRKHFRTLFIAISGASVLAACGGGGGGGDAAGASAVAGAPETANPGAGGTAGAGGTVGAGEAVGVGQGDVVVVSMAAGDGVAVSGGGGGTLAVNLSYGDAVQLFRQSVLSPTITGLEGRLPNCELASGTLPAGMTVNSDCSISGTPLQPGSFSFVVSLGASGVSNRLAWNASVLVMAPSVVYSIPTTMVAGLSYDLPLLNTIFWTPTQADVVTYSVIEGELPPGLAIDPHTGDIAGTPTARGTYLFKIGVQVVNAGRAASVVQQFPQLVTVNVAEVSYIYSPAVAGKPFRATPYSSSGGPTYTYSATELPPGLSIDAVTGVIGGTPTQLGGGTYRIELAAQAAGGGTFTSFTNAFIMVESPVRIEWASPRATHGLPFSSVPIIQGDTLLGAISYTYALAPTSALPIGLALDPTTGRISGTPTTAGSVTVTINVTITLDGTTFVMPVTVPIVIS